MNKLFFLDDERNLADVTWFKYPAYDEVIVLRNFDQFKKAIDEYEPNDLAGCSFSFDHDLQDFNEDGTENTGLTCAKYLTAKLIDSSVALKDIDFAVHSRNPIGAKQIEAEMQSLAHCDSCGYKGPGVYSDGYGFNICTVSGWCDSYTARGLSPADFL